jgi:hypothetical protein
MALALAERSQVIIDLALIHLRLVASTEGCACSACQHFDGDFDVDILARNRLGRPVLVAYRRQTRYSYDTITTRLTTDRGSADSQVGKIMTGKSLAHLHVQSYRDHIVVVDARGLSRALQSPTLWRCPEHGPTALNGDGGQTFVATCLRCMPGAKVIRRPAP